MADPPTLYFNPDRRYHKSQQALQQALSINEMAGREVVAVQDTASLKQAGNVPSWLRQSPSLAIITYQNGRPQLALYPPNSVMEKLKALSLEVAQSSALGEEGGRLHGSSASLRGRSTQAHSVDDLHTMGPDRATPLGPSVSLKTGRPVLSEAADGNTQYRNLARMEQQQEGKLGQASLGSRAMPSGGARDIQAMLSSRRSREP